MSLVVEFVASLDESGRSQCLSHASTALFILRSLSPVEQGTVLRLLCGGALEATGRLETFHLVRADGNLQENFAEALKIGLAATDESESRMSGKIWIEKGVAESLGRWESVVQLVGDPRGKYGERAFNPGSEVMAAALSEGLLRSVGKKKKKKNVEAGDTETTGIGFAWLLENTHRQLWRLLLAWVRNKNVSQSAELLETLTRGALARPWRGGAEQMFGPLGIELGLVDSRGNRTALADALCGAQEAKGYLILENNFRVYCYRESATAIRALALFARLETRLPGLVVATITRRSAQYALLEGGLSADQLLGYLRTHAHPKQRERAGPVIPDAVADQLRAWEEESSRLICQPGVLLSGFPSKELFEASLRVARDAEALLWSHPWKLGSADGGQMFVTESSIETISNLLAKFEL